MERAMQKHGKTQAENQEEQKANLMMNMTYQEVPLGSMSDEESKTDEN